MYITFSWPKADVHEKSAQAVVLPIMDRLLRTLQWEVGVEGHLKDREVLYMEVEGLSNNVYALPLMGIYNVPIWQEVEDVVEMLREFGIEPLVLVNGEQTILAYAGQEEARARYFRQALESAREAVKATRRWFKDSRLAAIRQGINDCFARESSVEFMGYRRVLIVVDKK
ncbi:MAG: hypothetical protein AAB948_01230 [Patescibacteria group bacterium]